MLSRMAHTTRSFLLLTALGTSLFPIAGADPVAHSSDGEQGRSPTPPPGRKSSLDLQGDPLPQRAVARMGTVRLRTGETITALVCSSDARTLYSASRDSLIRAWALADGKEASRFAGHKGEVSALALQPRGDLLASGGRDGTIRLWDVKLAKQVRCISCANSVLHLAFSPDGKVLASADRNGRLNFWVPETGEENRQLNLEGLSGKVRGLSYSPDGKSLAVSLADGPRNGVEQTIVLFDLTANRRVAKWRLGSSCEPRGNLCPGKLLFSPDSSCLAVVSGPADEMLLVLDAKTGKRLREYHADRNSFGPVSFSPDGKTLTAITGSTVLHCQPASDVEPTEEGPKVADILSLCYSPDGRFLITANRRSIDVQFAANRRQMHTFEAHQLEVYGVTVSPDGRIMATAGEDRLIRLWDTHTGKAVGRLEGHSRGVAALQFSAKGKLLASTSFDGTVRIWDVTRREQRSKLGGFDRYVKCLAFSPDETHVITGEEDGTVRLLNVVSGKEVWRRTGHQGTVNTIALSPDGKVAYSGGADKLIKSWAVDQAEPVPLVRCDGAVTALAISPDGGTLAFAEVGREGVTICGTASRYLSRRFTGQADGSVLSLAFSPDGRSIVGGGADRTVRIWEVSTGGERAVLRGHQGEVYSVAFSPSGRSILSGSSDTTVLVWDCCSWSEN